MPGEANTLSVSVAISRGDSTVNPVNSGETDSEVRDTCVSSKGQRSKRDTPVGSEEDSPIRDAQG